MIARLWEDNKQRKCLSANAFQCAGVSDHDGISADEWFSPVLPVLEDKAAPFGSVGRQASCSVNNKGGRHQTKTKREERKLPGDVQSRNRLGSQIADGGACVVRAQ